MHLLPESSCIGKDDHYTRDVDPVERERDSLRIGAALR